MEEEGVGLSAPCSFRKCWLSLYMPLCPSLPTLWAPLPILLASLLPHFCPSFSLGSVPSSLEGPRVPSAVRDPFRPRSYLCMRLPPHMFELVLPTSAPAQSPDTDMLHKCLRIY